MDDKDKDNDGCDDDEDYMPDSGLMMLLSQMLISLKLAAAVKHVQTSGKIICMRKSQLKEKGFFSGANLIP